jgi:uncharacterized protein
MKTLDIAAVNLESCHQMVGTTKPFILVIEKNEKLIETIAAFATLAQIKSASIYGIGAIRDPELAYFEASSKQYHTKQFHGDFEVISLSGNITKHNDGLAIHLHAALGDEKYQLIAGHLKNATVAVTIEMTVIPFTSTINRTINSDFNLPLIQP